MLKPTKHMNPDQSVLVLASVALKRLKKVRVERYADLTAFLEGKVPSAKFLFAPGISFLFILGLIQYQPKSDTFEYVGP